MKINSISLLKQHKELAKVYLISSDEFLLCHEAIQVIKKLAHLKGFELCKAWQVDHSFSWQTFLNAGTQHDLFGENTLFELCLMSLKIGNEGSAAISEFLKQQTEQQVLIIHCGKLDANALKSKWLTVIDQSGYIVQLWPPERHAFPQWIAERLQQQQIKVSAAALRLIADNSEGNLLAAQQSIERLYLQYGSCSLTDDEVYAALYDNARYTIFDLVDAWLSYDKIRTNKIFNSLKSDGTEAILILWALTRECRLLAILQQELKTAQFSVLINKYKIWQKRISLIKQHLEKNYNYFNYLQQLAKIERLLKGVSKGNIWDELQRFLLLTTNNQ